MSRRMSVWFAAGIAIFVSTVLASAQVTSSLTEVTSQPSSSGPVAYVYVSSLVGNASDQVLGYQAAADGSLTPIPGSPFAFNVSSLALNGAWLFGVNRAGQKIGSFSIGPNGALRYRDQYTTSLTGGSLYDLFLDHTGASLYAIYYTTNNDYLSHSIDQETGQLSFLNDLSGGPDHNVALSFIGNNQFAYASSCYHFTPEIFGVQRASNGSLSYLNITPPFPAEKSGGFYCPWAAAADPTNHLAIALTPLNANWGSDGPTQLAVYTADSSGNLTTTSTYQNMPAVLTQGAQTYWMSPSGKYLAVAGSGLQIFHFNGANPITKFTGLLTTDTIGQVYWDNANHLYAISYSANKLYVFSVTATGVTQAPGSPHTITAPQSLIVLPRT
ncbi:MAG: lactonase family protein [Candidatus Sulfotelmatobacter sp.]